MPFDLRKGASVPPAAPEPLSVAEALKTKREPPPEDASSIKNRRLVVLSFWLLALLVGLPTWWKTTTVYRANLPVQQMSEWAERKVSVLHFSRLGRAPTDPFFL